jgi:hypothetical protein
MEGFVHAQALARDRWFDAVRSTPEYGRILQKAESRLQETVGLFDRAGGPELLELDVRARRMTSEPITT